MKKQIDTKTLKDVRGGGGAGIGLGVGVNLGVGVGVSAGKSGRH